MSGRRTRVSRPSISASRRRVSRSIPASPKRASCSSCRLRGSSSRLIEQRVDHSPGAVGLVGRRGQRRRETPHQGGRVGEVGGGGLTHLVERAAVGRRRERGAQGLRGPVGCEGGCRARRRGPRAGSRRSGSRLPLLPAGIEASNPLVERRMGGEEQLQSAAQPLAEEEVARLGGVWALQGRSAVEAPDLLERARDAVRDCG